MEWIQNVRRGYRVKGTDIGCGVQLRDKGLVYRDGISI